jgi:hypothetical protein
MAAIQTVIKRDFGSFDFAATCRERTYGTKFPKSGFTSLLFVS